VKPDGILKLGGTLFIVTIVAAVALGKINSITRPKIEEQERLEKQQAIRSVMPDAAVFIRRETKNGKEYYEAYKNPDTTVSLGYVTTAYGSGFSSTVRTIVGMDKTGRIRGVKVVYQQETPGLGTHSQDDWFQKQFIGLTTNELLVDKDGGKVKAITGATITSRAVTNSIKRSLNELFSYLPPLGTERDSLNEGENR